MYHFDTALLYSLVQLFLRRVWSPSIGQEARWPVAEFYRYLPEFFTSVSLLLLLTEAACVVFERGVADSILRATQHNANIRIGTMHTISSKLPNIYLQKLQYPVKSAISVCKNMQYLVKCAATSSCKICNFLSVNCTISILQYASLVLYP